MYIRLPIALESRRCIHPTLVLLTAVSCYCCRTAAPYLYASVDTRNVSCLFTVRVARTLTLAIVKSETRQLPRIYHICAKVHMCLYVAMVKLET